MKIWSYPKVYNLGHPKIEKLFHNPVVVQEKVDGSQISFGLLDNELVIRSKGAEIFPDNPEKMFGLAVEVIKTLTPHPGWVYRAEYLQKPKHNVLAYARVPQNHLMLYDIEPNPNIFWDTPCVEAEANKMGLESVPTYAYPLFEDEPLLGLEDIKDFLQIDSCLGGQKVEGVVVKNYQQFGEDAKVLMGKYVSPEFKEIHGGEWRKANPTTKDIVQELINRYRTPARWGKAIQHLTERGILENSTKDIGLLMRELQQDSKEELSDEVKEILFEYYWPKIQRGLGGGFPEWYKERLLERQFEINA